MESFFRTYEQLLKNRSTTIRRGLLDKISPEERLIGIVGARGIGKTTFLLDIAAERYEYYDRRCLYVSLNQFYFTVTPLIDFVEEFVAQGGELLLLDQIFKYPSWRQELLECYHRYPQLRIIYSGSPLIVEENSPLPGKVYELPGLSLREYIYAQSGILLPTVTLDEIIKHHVAFAREVQVKTNPNNWLAGYLSHGYYPSREHMGTAVDNILKNINMTLEVDLMYIRNIDQRLLPKLRKLMYVIAQEQPTPLNVSNLAKSINTSRATATNYVNSLQDARLVKLVQKIGETEVKVPYICYLNNTNLIYALMPTVYPYGTFPSDVCRTFFLNQMEQVHHVEASLRRNVHFLIDQEKEFRIDHESNSRYAPHRYYAANGIVVGSRNVIPLWQFGFLY